MPAVRGRIPERTWEARVGCRVTRGERVSDVTPEQAMSRIAKIDQELAFHSGTSGARAAVDATRDDLVFWKDFLGSTAEELKGATETIESTVEDLNEGSLATGPVFTSEEVTEALDGDDSSLSEWIKAAQEKTDGIVGDFVAAGDVTPESLEEEIEEFTGTFEEVIEGLTERASGTSSGSRVAATATGLAVGNSGRSARRRA